VKVGGVEERKVIGRKECEKEGAVVGRSGGGTKESWGKEGGRWCGGTN
jgi:hypothetical protein